MLGGGGGIADLEGGATRFREGGLQQASHDMLIGNQILALADLGHESTGAAIGILHDGEVFGVKLVEFRDAGFQVASTEHRRRKAQEEDEQESRQERHGRSGVTRFVPRGG